MSEFFTAVGPTLAEWNEIHRRLWRPKLIEIDPAAWSGSEKPIAVLGGVGGLVCHAYVLMPLKGRGGLVATAVLRQAARASLGGVGGLTCDATRVPG